ncbi:MAG: polyphosphate kinase 1 [Bryobacterales bacterium]|nr:polyphosphate kinase 1 [Bryobacterales bacterium]
MPSSPAASESPSATPAAAALDDPRLYLNRELSLLKFQRRVLEEAQDESNPLLERVKFLSILGSNLDEFFMVRVAGLQNQVESGILETGQDGLSPVKTLEAVAAEFTSIMDEAHQCLDRLIHDLAENGIHILQFSELSFEQREFASRYFMETIFPVLTPLAHDPGRPFPHISNLSLNLSAIVEDEEGRRHFARVKVPDTLPQLAPLQTGRVRTRPLAFVWIEQVIHANLSALFPGMNVVESYAFHVTRDADTAIQELESGDLLETVEESVRQRRFGAVVRLKVAANMPGELLALLKENLEADDFDVFRQKAPLALSRLRHLSSLDRPELKEAPFVPALLEGATKDEDIFATIRRHDVLLHHPFDSFQPVVDFIRTAARDPQVLAIKTTLYRVGRNAPIVEALLEANEFRKQVAVVVELKARFDEESNIEWARALERQGVHVVYGFVDLKIHAKVAMVVRREGDLIRRYVHLATGNYNAVTASLYTDLGLFTCDPDIGADATDLFNYLTAYSAKKDYRKLVLAPIAMRQRLEQLIEREIAHARAGRPARLIFKVNALADPRTTRLLYEASRAGVEIDLIVRGVCTLLPGVAGVSENIRVRSIVGRFLEHSRIYYFHNGGRAEVYLASADLMSRNISRRVEVMFPIENPSLRQHIRDRILAVYLDDNVKAREMTPDGRYQRVRPAEGQPAVNAQLALLRSRTGAR